MSQPESFTGRARGRSTSRGVLVVDRLARGLISIGGLGTIFAVLGVFLFLLWVVVPLFLPAEIDSIRAFESSWGERPLHLGVDEYQNLGWVLLPSGRVEVFRLDSGETRLERQLFSPGELTAASFLIDRPLAVFGLADGSVRTAEIGFESAIQNLETAAGELRRAFAGMEPGAVVSHGDGVAELIPGGQLRTQWLSIRLDAPTPVSAGPVRRVGHAIGPDGPMIAVLTEGPLASAVETEGAGAAAGETAGTGEGPTAATMDRSPRLSLIVGEEQSSFLTGTTSLTFREPRELAFEALAAGLPDHLAFSGTGNDVFVAWRDGSLLRVDCSDPARSFVAEKARLTQGGASLEDLRFILGNNTLAWSDSAGRVRAGFLIRTADYAGETLPESWRSERTDFLLVETKELGDASSPATALAPSSRGRLLLAGFGDGRLRLLNVTHSSELADLRLPGAGAVEQLVVSPKENGLVATSGNRVFRADLDPRYSDASFRALFRPVWYEGYAEPTHSWQSSSGTDDFEPKHGLMPLIFGTLKATFYSMLFGAPLALLAAIYTSELLQPEVRSVVKPTIELMAGLPSVVLGFLAALVIAPFVERIVPATLASFLTLPLAFLAGAYLWQLLPNRVALALGRWRFAFISLAVPLGIALAMALGPFLEAALFAGDLEAWLAWDAGTPGAEERFSSAVGGWMFLMVPLSALAVAFAMDRFVTPWLRERDEWSRRRLALADAGRFLLGIVAAFGLALLFSLLLDALGFDPRGSYIDTYMQRNAMIVGFVMGFAIIPIIYTISEDALSTVPEHLRSASLGAGATRWQTATRIVIPTAMSGLFSALMIGLGRAVGETMIVLMAAGNTPVMEWNLFEGFRTLSANIAVELPEAVQGSTHYRTLFLAALVLFAMTFLVNTVAEIVRLRFRKRAFQL